MFGLCVGIVFRRAFPVQNSACVHQNSTCGHQNSACRLQRVPSGLQTVGQRLWDRRSVGLLKFAAQARMPAMQRSKLTSRVPLGFAGEPEKDSRTWPSAARALEVTARACHNASERLEWLLGPAPMPNQIMRIQSERRRHVVKSY